MPEIVLDEKMLNKRAPQLFTFLGPILREDNVPSSKLPRFNKVIIVAGKSITEDYRDSRFLTSYKGIKALYFEEWTPRDIRTQSEWLLTKSYLNLYRILRTTHSESEFICLHSDPIDPNPFKYSCD